MDVFRLLQEKYIEEFTNNVPIGEFLLNILITAILTVVLRWFYIRYGSAISNRKKFGNNFLPLALGTMLIIMIVKSSIALSLGLVGALSIVRFRAAIKDPEELTYLFIAIGVGLAGGADQPVLAVVSVSVILLILFLHKRFTGQLNPVREDRMFVNIQTDVDDLEAISNILTNILPYVELKRMDTLDKGLDLSFICRANNLKQLAELKNKLQSLSANTRLSIVDQPDLII